MATEVPVSMNRLLLIRILAFIDLALGFISFIFQIGLLTYYGFPSDAAGIWCGIFFIIAGSSALFALRNSRNQNIKLVAIGSACLAFIFGIVQMGLTSAFIDAWSWVPTIIIQNIQNSFFSVNAVRALIAIILICSVVAIPVNVVLSIALCSVLHANN